ncbi:helix-turn-helix domain-containing protein [Streptococcus lutetiensis]|uniref:helix-turn-helix domain-containing protein n=1 Tax=Streptococcus lutetiensis TaxID=150055 RepID=UPI0010DFF702|nr:helix-turn-helix transcriptional regulator [Streptococcus lutetiensis]VTS99160.1 transcriptional regulator [Streptococcus lutetiensis]
MNRLKELRKEKKLTQQELADYMQVTRRGYQKWENGESQIKPDKAKELADFFGVSVSYLLGYTLEEPSKYEQLIHFISKYFKKKESEILCEYNKKNSDIKISTNNFLTEAENEYKKLGLEGTLIDINEYTTFYIMNLKEPLKELLINFAKSPKENQEAVLSLLRTTSKKQPKDKQ